MSFHDAFDVVLEVLTDTAEQGKIACATFCVCEMDTTLLNPYINRLQSQSPRIRRWHQLSRPNRLYFCVLPLVTRRANCKFNANTQQLRSDGPIPMIACNLRFDERQLLPVCHATTSRQRRTIRAMSRWPMCMPEYTHTCFAHFQATEDSITFAIWTPPRRCMHPATRPSLVCVGDVCLDCSVRRCVMHMWSSGEADGSRCNPTEVVLFDLPCVQLFDEEQVYTVYVTLCEPVIEDTVVTLTLDHYLTHRLVLTDPFRDFRKAE